MTTHKILKQGKNIAFILVIIAVGVYHYVNIQRNLGEDAKRVIRASIVSQRLSDALNQQPKSMEEMSEADAERYGKQLLELQNIEITSLSARGAGREVVAKVEYDSANQNSEVTIRYFRLIYELPGGWRIAEETDALSYYLKLW